MNTAVKYKDKFKVEFDPKNQTVRLMLKIRHVSNNHLLLYDGIENHNIEKKLVKINKDGTFTVPLWLAEQKGWW